MTHCAIGCTAAVDCTHLKKTLQKFYELSQPVNLIVFRVTNILRTTWIFLWNILGFILLIMCCLSVTGGC